MGVGSRCSCRGIFRKHICVCALIIFVVNNLESFQSNSSIHGINTRKKTHLHGPVVNLSCFQKDVSYSCIKILNPTTILELKNDKLHFKVLCVCVRARALIRPYLNTT